MRFPGVYLDGPASSVYHRCTGDLTERDATMGGLSQRVACAAGVGLLLLWGCSEGDGGGNGTDRSGGKQTTTPINGNAGAPPAAGSSPDFNNGAGVMPMQPRMMQPGQGPGVNETTTPDEVKCGGARFTPMIERTIIPGNILLIADKSGSMMQPFPATGTQKGDEARKAIANAIGALKDLVKVGTVFFPETTGCTGGDCSCHVPAFANTPPQIPFTPGPAFLNTWNSAYFPINNGNTPLSEGLQSADKALIDNLPTLTGTTIVVVVTDGAPNCVLDELPVSEKLQILTPLPTKWLGMGVKTYVIGLPGADQPDAVTVLDGVANAGGTMKHIPASDPMTVQTELSKIIGESVMSNFESCTIPLEKKPPDPNDVNLLVTMGGMDLAVDRDLGTSGGWTLNQDATQIVLQGTFCERARMGEYQNITVVFGCVDAPPLPPPPPVM